ncbi:MAG: 30S ribosomal protein S12 methylthiotransferase RimO [Planctomycetes bacterium]|nr:30S ribosomal protein S12 methylthiotransferase RimO [Planctomycetota bacterium]
MTLPPPAGKPRVAFVSLGCPKNLVDSEMMLGQLGSATYTICDRAEDADVVVVNTCGFLEASKQESLGVIREMVDLKHRGAVQRVVVAGCLAQRDADGVRDAAPGVDAIVGVNERDRLAEICDALSVRPAGGAGAPRPRPRAGAPRPGLPPGARRASGAARSVRPASVLPDPDGPLVAVLDEESACTAESARLRLTPRHYAYLKISEGCDNPCTFCTIPSIRGTFRSKPPDQVLLEARELAADGTRELIVIGQDTTFYGADLPARPRLARLLESLAGVRGVDWIRLLYAYPRHFDDDLLRVLRDLPQMTRYLDMPIQHIADPVLQRMRRGGEKRIRRIVERCRTEIPGLTLRTTVIVGFPGETEAEFAQLLAFLCEARFDRLGAFQYSAEPGTPAALLDGQIPPEVKQARWDAVMAQQREIAFARNAALVGTEVSAIVDSPPGTPRGAWVGRTLADAPEIDQQILIRGPGLQTGEIVTVRVTGVRGYDLVGRVAPTRGA